MSTIFCTNEQFEAFMNNGGNSMLHALMKSFKCSGNEDVFQELSMEAAKAILSYTPACESSMDLFSWVQQCCTRAMFMLVSHENAQAHKAKNNMERNKEKQEAKSLLGKILQDAELTSVQKYVVKQTMNGVSKAEIAKELKCSETKVFKVYREALMILRNTNTARAAMAV